MAVSSVKATVNGQVYTLTYNSTAGSYEAVITAPSKSSYNSTGHFYDVSLTAKDDAGNSTTVDSSSSTFGDSLKLYVKETVAPVQTITSPTSSSAIVNNTPAVKWNVTDNDSGVNPDTISITIDGTKITSGITKTAKTGGYDCIYTPVSALADGSHTIAVDVADYDGNSAVQASVTFKIDTVPPTLNVSSPADSLVTNNAKCTVSGTTNDVTSSPVTLTLKLNAGDEVSVTVGSDGAFSKAVTLTEGDNTITITATDGAGKVSTVTRTVKLDTKAPEIQTLSITPNPVNSGKTFTISIKVAD